MISAYAKEIETGIAAHYPGRHVREWHQGTMSSRELINMIEGLPPDSWFRGVVREDMDELIGDVTVHHQKDIRQKTLALLRGEHQTSGEVVIETDMGDPDGPPTVKRRRSRRADQA